VHPCHFRESDSINPTFLLPHLRSDDSRHFE
jgi:hypothetical protein